MDRDHPVYRAVFLRSDQVAMGDAHRMKRRVDLSPPMIEKAAQPGKSRRKIILLESQYLQQSRVIGHVIMNFDRGQAISGKLVQEIAVSLWSNHTLVRHAVPPSKTGAWPAETRSGPAKA
jgi:hypothetical protein